MFLVGFFNTIVKMSNENTNRAAKPEHVPAPSPKEAPIDIKSLIADAPEAWIKHEGSGMEFKLRFTNRTAITKIFERNSVHTYDPKLKARVPKVNQEKAMDELIRTRVLDWRNVTLRQLREYLPIPQRLSDSVLDKPLPFDHEQLQAVLMQSAELDTWIQDSLVNPRLFSDIEEETKNS